MTTPTQLTAEQLEKLMSALDLDDTLDEEIDLEEVRQFAQTAIAELAQKTIQAMDDLLRMSRLAGEKIGKGERFTRRDMGRMLNTRDSTSLVAETALIEEPALPKAPAMNGGYL